jgi:hypothetical protein
MYSAQRAACGMRPATCNTDAQRRIRALPRALADAHACPAHEAASAAHTAALRCAALQISEPVELRAVGMLRWRRLAGTR